MNQNLHVERPFTKMKHQSFLYCTKPFLTDSHLEYETKTFSEVLTEELAQAE